MKSGALYNLSLLNSSSPSFISCYFSHNTAVSFGVVGNVNPTFVGVTTDSNQPSFINSVFYKNSVTDKGGAIYNSIAAPTIINCTFVSNTAASGGAIYNADDSNLSITNAISSDIYEHLWHYRLFDYES